MTEANRLDIHDKCFTVHADTGCLLIRAPAKTGYEHILCVEGDRRVLCSAFDEYVACDAFEHYVLCRDINYLTGQTVSRTGAEIKGKEIQFVYKNIDDCGTLEIATGDDTATITTCVTQPADEKIFTFGTSDDNVIQFTEPATKRLVVGKRTITVTFISFKSAVYTIDQILSLGFPEIGIA